MVWFGVRRSGPVPDRSVRPNLRHHGIGRRPAARRIVTVLGIYDDLAGTSDIIGNVLDDPNAPISPGDVDHLQDVTERGTYWNDRFGQLTDIEDYYDHVDSDIREQLEAQQRHQLESETLAEIDQVLREINSWPNVIGGPSYPTYPTS